MAYGTQTSRSHWFKMTPYRVDMGSLCRYYYGIIQGELRLWCLPQVNLNLGQVYLKGMRMITMDILITKYTVLMQYRFSFGNLSALTLNAHKGGPLGPMILFFASPVKTRKDFLRSFLHNCLTIGCANFWWHRLWYRSRCHFQDDYRTWALLRNATKLVLAASSMQ